MTEDTFKPTTTAAFASGNPGFEFMHRHRRWLEKAKLSGRPWFFLASAPDPTIPAELPAGCAHIYIKYAGLAGRKLGLPEPDLILVDYHMKRQISGLDCHRVLYLTSTGRRVLLDCFKHRIPFIEPRMMHLSRAERDRVCNEILGSAFRDVGSMVRPSNGIALICYAILMGVPRIIISGMSLTDNGHSNPNRAKVLRLHREEDQASFAHFAKHYPSVETSEPELASLTGLPLYKG